MELGWLKDLGTAYRLLFEFDVKPDVLDVKELAKQGRTFKKRGK